MDNDYSKVLELLAGVSFSFPERPDVDLLEHADMCGRRPGSLIRLLRTTSSAAGRHARSLLDPEC